MKIIFTISLLICICGSERGKYPKIGSNTAEIIRSFGYPVEVHYIPTDDGYILGVQRIPYGKNNTNPNKEAIILAHGLFGSSSNYVDIGPGKGLAFILADAGYDVWLHNARGTSWSRNHTKFSPNSKQFWNFSWHEIGYHDNPAMIDYILKLKSAKSLYYIGHSQGTTTFLVMASTRPEYNDKVKLACLLAPSAFNKHNNNKFFAFATQFEEQYKFLFDLLQVYELPPFGNQIRHFLADFCTLNKNLCQVILSSVTELDNNDYYENMMPVIVSNFPATASTKQLVHYGQIVRFKKFAWYDYGTRLNKLKYGTALPPLYNVSNITIPVSLYYGNKDTIVNYKDVQDLAKVLPNLANNYMLPYSHLGFVYAKDAPTVLFPKILKDLETF